MSFNNERKITFTLDKKTNIISKSRNNLIQEKINQHIDMKTMIDAYKTNNEVYISLQDWYNHYKIELKKVYYDFIDIASNHNITIRDNEYSFHDFIKMMYNECNKKIRT